ncbi:MAG: ferritin family protein [Desulfuromonadales bacterium]|nr:ferritin family protein [Desulfuromonadales bacterium]
MQKKGITMNLIECTIKMKEEAKAHYERLVEAVSDKDMKRVFSLLASAEEEHLHMLRNMKDRILTKMFDDFGVDESVCTYSPNIDSHNIREALHNDPDAYLHVTREERETIEFFEQLARDTRDESMKKLCMRLAHQERKHLNKIENIYSFVEDPRTYLEWGEFSNNKTL